LPCRYPARDRDRDGVCSDEDCDDRDPNVQFCSTITVQRPILYNGQSCTATYTQYTKWACCEGGTAPEDGSSDPWACCVIVDQTEYLESIE
jgi:hypothetical protein